MTMTHPSEGQLQALMDGEVPQEDRVTLESHLRACAPCRQRLAALEAASVGFSRAVRSLDVPAPTELAHRRFRRQRRRRAFTGTPLRWAAILVVGTAATLSATLPGSPVRAWLTGADQDDGTVEERVEVARNAGEAGDISFDAGVSVEPRGDMRVVFVASPEGLRVRVRLHDGPRVNVLAGGAAESARFRTGSDRIEVAGGGPGEVRVDVPRGVPRFTLEVDGRVYLSKAGDDLRFPGPAADTIGPEIVFEVQP